MSGLNKVLLIGRLGKDPEMKQLDNNVVKVSFPLATSEYYLDKSGQRQEKTEWHNIVIWRKLAENAMKILAKGRMVFIEGKLNSRSYTDKDNQQRYITEIVANSFTVLDRRDASQSSSDNASNDILDNDSVPFDNDGDDLPF